jgi:hypothetical protein
MGLCRWALGDPEWPKSAFSSGGKYAYDDDQETPNTQLASYDYGGREIVFEVRGMMTGGEGTPARRSNARSSRAGAPAPSNAGIPNIVTVGNLFYGSEGWASMDDTGFQAYKGETSELIMEERPERGPGSDATSLHMENFLAACRSRNVKDLHDPISNAHFSAGLCHLANISYRTGHKLNLGPGPRFTGDAEADKLLTRQPYRKPYVV